MIHNKRKMYIILYVFFSPAHCAAIKGCLETIKLLEKEKADLWHQNKRGDYPIHEAAQKGHIGIVIINLCINVIVLYKILIITSIMTSKIVTEVSE